ncbi:MAG: deoxyribodipyrimidine photo-lyase [Bacteroidota bacterium]
MSRYQLALHIFRRDLRVEDNTALYYALRNAKKVIPCFIFDKRQVKNNSYQSMNAVQFMVASIKDLSQQLKLLDGKLYLFYGIAEEVIEQLCQKLPIDLITINRDYTPFSLRRDSNIQKIAKKYEVICYQLGDALLQEPEEVSKSDGTPYTVFTPFFKKASQLPVRMPVTTQGNHYAHLVIPEAKEESFLASIVPFPNPTILLQGGSQEANRLLEKVTELVDYARLRDYPREQYTSLLSAHHKFGTIPIRKTYHVLRKHFGSNHRMIVELYWRDFFTHIAYHYPHVWGHAFQKKYDKIPWKQDQVAFQAWCQGTTGFPIVDAGMRELNTTGYMHNRVRMITASFLVKDLHIDWKWGERYFAQQLTDYDPAVNNGNWQWAASTGCDAQPYFRIFNPWRQQLRFDPEAVYIKKWVPELRDLTANVIHSLLIKQAVQANNYPSPIVDHQQAAKEAKEIFKEVL